jgi:hypothetical protein
MVISAGYTLPLVSGKVFIQHKGAMFMQVAFLSTDEHR